MASMSDNWGWTQLDSKNQRKLSSGVKVVSVEVTIEVCNDGAPGREYLTTIPNNPFMRRHVQPIKP